MSSLFKTRTIGHGFVCPPCSPDRAVPDRATGIPRHSRLERAPSPARSSVEQALRFNETGGFLERWSMGWSWRRSISLGPFRLNLSRSGVGISFGAGGARVSTGPRGSFTTLGLGGFRYSKRIAPPPPHQATPAPTNIWSCSKNTATPMRQRRRSRKKWAGIAMRRTRATMMMISFRSRK